MQKIIKAYKTELKLNNKQITYCTNHINATRFAWNWGLARRIKMYKEHGKTLNAISLHRELNALKKTDFAWMYSVSKRAHGAKITMLLTQQIKLLNILNRGNCAGKI